MSTRLQSDKYHTGMHTLVLNADLNPITLIPLSTIEWRDAVKAVFLNTVSVVEEYPDWEVHSPTLTMRVPSVIMTKHYLHFDRQVAYSKEQIFLRDRYTCQYCYKIFPEGKLTLDHVLPSRHGGKSSWDNITTACLPCNLRKGSDKKIIPRILPRKPTYYELLAIRKEYPLVIPCEKWRHYLNWSEENLHIAA